jgi:lipopolysaccharide transport system ATP-binding protein
MSIAISVENLSKSYTIHHVAKQYATLREAVPATFRAAFTRLRHGPETGESSETFWALRDVSFSINKGERLGVIGRNGAGKSTLLKLLSRITEPTQGKISLRGRVASLLEVGTGFNPELTGRENIFLNASILGMSRRDIALRFDKIVAFAEVERFIDTPVKRYSSGMYMRLAFSVAAHIDPEVLIIDEVLAVGDAAFQKRCLEKMGEFGREERTVLFVSHSMSAVEKLCNRALFLESGRVVADSNDVGSVIKQYMRQGEGGELSPRWEATSHEYASEWFSPQLFRISDASGRDVDGAVSYMDEVWCEIEADIASMDTALTMGIAVFNEEGQCLFWSYQSDLAEELWPRFHSGRNTMRVRLPLEIFNGGLYRVELIGGLHFRQWLCEPGVSAPAVFFTMNERVSESPYWMKPRPNLIAPKLTWVIE